MVMAAGSVATQPTRVATMRAPAQLRILQAALLRPGRRSTLGLLFDFSFDLEGVVATAPVEAEAGEAPVVAEDVRLAA